jgi:hypothetical protein
MPPEMSTILISSMFSILVAIITAFLSSLFYVRNIKADLQREYQSRINERKWKTYTEFGAFVSKVFEEVNKGKVDTKRYGIEINRLAGDLWIVGSDRVIGAFIDWKQYTSQVVAGNAKDEGYLTLHKLAQIIIEMRKDLGYTDDKATGKDLLAVWFPDILKV